MVIILPEPRSHAIGSPKATSKIHVYVFPSTPWRSPLPTASLNRQSWEM